MKKENEAQIETVETKKQSVLSFIGFWLAIVSLFISFDGVVSLFALIISFIGLYKNNGDDAKGKKLALWGMGIGLGGLISASLQMMGIL